MGAVWRAIDDRPYEATRGSGFFGAMRLRMTEKGLRFPGYAGLQIKSLPVIIDNLLHE